MSCFDASGSPRARLDRLFEHPAVFNAYQALVDGGKMRQIRRFLAGLPFRSILDIGCGTGNWSHLAADGYLGVDSSPAFIEAARERYKGDPNKRFLLADASELELVQSYDLCLMISVLHHLSDAKVRAVLERVSTRCRNLFVLDLYPIPWNPASRALYALDRGDYIRSPQEQQRLLEEADGLRLRKAGSYFSPTFLYRHTLFLLENDKLGFEHALLVQ